MKGNNDVGTLVTLSTCLFSLLFITCVVHFDKTYNFELLLLTFVNYFCDLIYEQTFLYFELKLHQETTSLVAGSGGGGGGNWYNM
jgi:hypothetical protein